MKPFDLAVADTLDGAFEGLGKGYTVKAGGIDLVDRLKERIEKSDRIMSVLPLRDLAKIEARDGTRVLGALATLDDIIRDKTVASAFPALVQALSDAASPQVRVVATLAGNLCQRPRCWYFRSHDFECLKKGGATCYAVEGENQFHGLFGDGPCHIVHPSSAAPPLIAAGARFRVRGPQGERVIPASDFFTMPDKGLLVENSLKPDEMLLDVTVPASLEKSAWVEVRERQAFDWPLAACAAVNLSGKWQVVLGGVAPVPWRALKAEEALSGATSITSELASRAAEAAVADAKPMSQNSWRLKLVKAVVRRALLRADGKEDLT